MNESPDHVKPPPMPPIGEHALAYYEALAERLRLNPSDLRALELITAGEGITAGQLSDGTGLTSGAVTGVIDRLERAGLVRRQTDPADRRRIVVTAVPERAGELRQAFEPLRRSSAELLAGYGPAERAAITDYLARSGDLVAAEVERLRAAVRGGYVGNTYVAPLAGATRGRLQFISGGPRVSMNVAPFGPGASARIIMESSASRLTFTGAAPDDELIHAAFEGPLPDIRSSDGAVTIRYRRSPFSSRSAHIALSGHVPWSIVVEGGITDLGGVLDGIPLVAVDVHGGANHITLDLPPASGTVPVRVDGVVSSATLRRPSATPVSLRVTGGVSHLRLDDERHENVSGERVYLAGDFAAAPDRYELSLVGGASKVRVATR